MGRDKDMFASSTYTNKVWVTVGIIAFVVVMMLIFYYTLNTFLLLLLASLIAMFFRILSDKIK